MIPRSWFRRLVKTDPPRPTPVLEVINSPTYRGGTSATPDLTSPVHPPARPAMLRSWFEARRADFQLVETFSSDEHAEQLRRGRW